MKAASYHSLIQADELSAMLKYTPVVVLDCRYSLSDFNKGRQDYMKSHIPGSYFMDIGTDLSSPVIQGITGRHPLPHPEVLASALRAAGLSQDSQVVAYDQSNGMYASRAWWLCRWLGHDRVAVLDGGFQGWTEKNLPLDNPWPPPQRGDFEFRIDKMMVAGKEEVANMQTHLYDSRDHKRFTGEYEPIDPVAGHIPGAVCLPYADNTDEKGYWKSKEWLQQKFNAVSPSETSAPVFYCGSGVSACHNILAYKIATGKNARLYAGSWSEWIHYFPVAIGE